MTYNTHSPDVTFCGYSVPHPSEHKINLRIQTNGMHHTPTRTNNNMSDSLIKYSQKEGSSEFMNIVSLVPSSSLFRTQTYLPAIFHTLLFEMMWADRFEYESR